MSLPTLLPLSAETLRMLLRPRKTPCVSLAVPTHRAPAGDGDPVVLRHLADHVSQTLSATRSRAETERIIAPWRSLETDPLFWKRTGDGFVGYAADGESWIVPLDGPLEPAAHVGPRFDTLPLVRRLASTERRRVAIATSRQVRVCDASTSGDGRVTLAPVPLRDATGRTIPDGVVARDAIVELVHEEPHRVMHGMGAIGDAVHGGFGSRSEGIDDDTRRFLHDAATFLAAAPQAPPGGLVLVGLPRVVAALAAGLPRNHGPREEVSIDPGLLGEAELAHHLGDLLRGARRRREQALADTFREARAQGRASGDFVEAARAAVAGRIDTLLLEDGRAEPGRIDPRTGVVDFPPEPDGPVGSSAAAGDRAIDDDLFGALADLVLGHSGDVVILPVERMPTRTGIAATYRWGEQGPEPAGKGRPGGRA